MNVAREALELANEILAQPQFASLKPLGRKARKAKLIKCNAGCFLPVNWICYGEHSNPLCKDCPRKEAR